MNILKYLIAETINDNDTEEFIEFGQQREVDHDNVADSVFQLFAALTNSCAEVGSREGAINKSALADSAIVLGESLFAKGPLNVHLDTVH